MILTISLLLILIIYQIHILINFSLIKKRDEKIYYYTQLRRDLERFIEKNWEYMTDNQYFIIMKCKISLDKKINTLELKK